MVTNQPTIYVRIILYDVITCSKILLNVEIGSVILYSSYSNFNIALIGERISTCNHDGCFIFLEIDVALKLKQCSRLIIDTSNKIIY